MITAPERHSISPNVPILNRQLFAAFIIHNRRYRKFTALIVILKCHLRQARTSCPENMHSSIRSLCQRWLISFRLTAHTNSRFCLSSSIHRNRTDNLCRASSAIHYNLPEHAPRYQSVRFCLFISFFFSNR